jgi:fumarylacetoacetate (FAA) hydrolase family protein
MRVVQFHRPGHGPRTGVVRDGTVYDVTAEAGDALSLLLAHHAGVPRRAGCRREHWQRLTLRLMRMWHIS